MKKSKCPYKKSKCEFVNIGNCPFPNEFKDGQCVYITPPTHPCDKCPLKGNHYKRFGDVESGVMVVGGSNMDTPVDYIVDVLKQNANELNLSVSFYYTTAVKCLTDKKPSMAIIKGCNSYLKDEIAAIKPKYVLVLGETAFKALLWDFSLITKRKPEIDSCAGSHIEKDGITYFIVHDIKDIKNNFVHRSRFTDHIKKFIKLINGKIKIAPVKYKEIESEKELIYITEEAERTGRVAVDIETDPFTAFLPNSEILTLSFTVKERESFCIPLSWQVGNYFKKWNFTPKMSPFLSITYINKILKNPKITKIFHNAAFDVTWLEHMLSLRSDNLDDTMIMKFLMNQDEQDKKSLKYLTKQYLDMGYYEYNIKQYVGDGEPYSNIPPKILMEYNCADTDATLRLWNLFRPKLKELQLEKIHYEFMIPKLRSIINLQKSGIPLDVNHCVKMKAENEDKLVQLFSELRSLPQVANFERETGLEFKSSSPKHKFAMVYGGEVTTAKEAPRRIVNGKKTGKKVCVKLNYNGFNLEPITIAVKSPITGKREQRISFGKKAIQKYLKSIYKDVEFLDPINTFNLGSLPSNTDIMKFIKLTTEISSIQTQLSNHIEPFINIWGKTVDKCVHTSYDLTGTATGRLASRTPNLLNLKRDGFVKEAFVSRWGNEGILIEADYKQLELFVMAIVSQDPIFVHAFTHGIDLHLKTAANIVFRCAEKDVSKQMRTMAKTVNFGMLYGLSAYSLKDDLNVSEEEAQRIIDGFFKEYSGVKRYSDDVRSFARTRGYITTVMGRRRYLDYSSDPNGADRQAVNTTIQSPASDACITAVSQLQEYFEKASEKVAEVSGTVYDSIIVDCKKGYINEIVPAIQLIMENTGLKWITIPLKVDIKYGPNLREMKEWESGTKINLE